MVTASTLLKMPPTHFVTQGVEVGMATCTLPES